MSDPDPLSLMMRSLAERNSPGHAMAYKVEDFARSVYGDKRKDVDHIGIFKLVSNDEEVPGFSASDFDTRQFTKPVLSTLLESACSLLFKQCLPYFMQTRKLHDQVARLEKEAEEEKKTEVPATSTTTLQLSEELNAAQRKIIALQEQVIALKDDVRLAESSAVTKTVERDMKSFSTVLSQNCAVAMAPRRIQQAMRKATSSSVPEDRSCNLMIFGLPEETSKETIPNSVKGVLDQLNEKPVLDQCCRVGSPTAEIERDSIFDIEEGEGTEGFYEVL